MHFYKTYNCDGERQRNMLDCLLLLFFEIEHFKTNWYTKATKFQNGLLLAQISRRISNLKKMRNSVST